MKTHILTIFVLVLAVIWTLVFASARFEFSGVDYFKEESQAYKKKLKRQELRTALVETQLIEFQQHVAAVLPKKIHQNKAQDYPLRQLASTVKKHSGYKIKLIQANQYLKKGKSLFRKKDYGKANHYFKLILEYYSYSPEITEAYFLYSESLYQLRDFESCVQTIEKMMSLFPASELTGFAMLRLGRIFEIQKRSGEALEMYKTVVSTFPQRELASQASDSIRQLEL